MKIDKIRYVVRQQYKGRKDHLITSLLELSWVYYMLGLSRFLLFVSISLIINSVFTIILALKLYPFNEIEKNPSLLFWNTASILSKIGNAEYSQSTEIHIANDVKVPGWLYWKFDQSIQKESKRIPVCKCFSFLSDSPCQQWK